MASSFRTLKQKTTKATMRTGSAAGTTTTPKKLRRRIDGSPAVPRTDDHLLPPKTIYLIRHGQSLGQAAKNLGWDRKTDKRLIDCGLTELGVSQAYGIRKLLQRFNENNDVLDSIQLVVSSPLTRALKTALLAFSDKPILVGYDLREIGSKVPENTPRKMEAVLKDLAESLASRPSTTSVDVDTLRPPDWPRDFSPAVVKRDRLRKFFQYLYHSRLETTVAVVCHYNVIRSAVIADDHNSRLRPANAVPIPCHLYSNGDVEVIPTTATTLKEDELEVMKGVFDKAAVSQSDADDAAWAAAEDLELCLTNGQVPTATSKSKCVSEAKNEFSTAATYYRMFRGDGSKQSAQDSDRQQQSQDFWQEDIWTREDEEIAQQTLDSHLEKCTISSNRPLTQITGDEEEEDYDAYAWDQFYMDHGTRFFKDRHYLEKTFPDEFEAHPSEEKSSLHALQQCTIRTSRTLVEIGCGVGNAILPLTEGTNGKWDVIHGLDISQHAIGLLQKDDRFTAFNRSGVARPQPRAIFGHVCDISKELPPACRCVSDVTTLLFCMSAVDPSSMPATAQLVASTLKPGGRLVFRDYGRYDEAQMKLGTSRSKRIKDNFYQKHDGTKCFYFTLEEVVRLFGTIAGLDILEVKYLRRVYENKSTGHQRRRVWVQGRFRKPMTVGLKSP